jgi:acetolactate synthase I/II/III large subunit
MMRLADYVVQRLVAHGVRHVFLVTGGGAMHLNDAIGREPKLTKIYCHHEQACAMAAESYFRLTNRLAALSVTSGPGSTNAITGVYGAYVDSMGMIVVSGQVKNETLVRHTNLPLRQLGDQEADIVAMVKPVTKYAVVVEEPKTIRYHLERALHLATSGRPGPCWLDIPIDVQATKIEPEELPAYDPREDRLTFDTQDLPAAVEEVHRLLTQAKRPVIYAGTGIRLSAEHARFLRLADRLGIPIVTAFNSHDLIPDAHPAYAGRPGSLGTRGGNFVVQNADLVLILGCRMNIRLVSYNWENFAPASYKIMVDIDAAELKKPTLKVDLPIHADLAQFLPLLDKATVQWRPLHAEWLAWCRERVERYPVVLPEYAQSPQPVNPYCFMDALFRALKEEEIVVCADGTACVTAFQAAIVKPGQRLFHNSGCAPMGYELPAAIGAAFACPEAGRIICLAGDGSIMMNLQELQTIVGLRLPVKIFILNNSGYHSIRQTQTNFFPDNIMGCGTDSGLSFPSFEKIAAAFGFSYTRCATHAELPAAVAATLEADGPALCEVVLDLRQPFAPKLTSRKLEDGRMVSSPLEDMAPFLSREELRSNMILPKPGE